MPSILLSSFPPNICSHKYKPKKKMQLKMIGNSDFGVECVKRLFIDNL